MTNKLTTFEQVEELVNKAKRPEDVFGDQKDFKDNFRRLVLLAHPDANPTKSKAQSVFQNLNNWHQKALKKIADKTYGNKIIATIKSKKNTYEITDLLVAGNLCDVYSATDQELNNVVLKILRTPKNKDLLLNEAKVLEHLRHELITKKLKNISHIPNLRETFEINQSGIKRQINVLDKLKYYYTLEEVRASYPHGVELKAVAWMWNRMLAAVQAAHLNGLVHGALTPDHFMICPETHNGHLIDWSYCVKTNTKLKAINPKYKDFYPLEVFDKQVVDFSTDIFMSVKCVIFLLGGELNKPKVSLRLRSFWKHCLLNKKHRPTDVSVLHKEFLEILQTIFGPREFYRFEMPKK